MPLPLAYDACRVSVSIASASCGVPVTTTGRVNDTSTSIRSVRPYVLSLAGALVIATPLGADVVNVPPATLWPVLFVIACTPSPSTAFVAPPDTRIVPLFSASAPDPMLKPSASASAATTTYRNASVSVPVPDA